MKKRLEVNKEQMRKISDEARNTEYQKEGKIQQYEAQMRSSQDKMACLLQQKEEQLRRVEESLQETIRSISGIESSPLKSGKLGLNMSPLKDKNMKISPGKAPHDQLTSILRQLQNQQMTDRIKIRELGAQLSQKQQDLNTLQDKN